MHTNETIKCVIIDDEPLAQDVIKQYILQYKKLELIGMVNSAIAAFEVLHKEHVDLIFLDINMPIVDGLSFIKSLKHPPKVIITTAYSEHALEAFNLDVIDYLLKPISLERFDKAIQKSMLHFGDNIISKHQVPIHSSGNQEIKKEYFFIKVDGKLVKLNYDSIIYIEGMKDYLKIITTNKPLIVHSTFKNMEEQLPNNKFVRVHKSYILNIDSIKSIDGNLINLNNDQITIPIGNMYKEQVLKILG